MHPRTDRFGDQNHGEAFMPAFLTSRSVVRKKAMSKPNSTILVADDDELLRQLIEYRLTSRGHKVLCAADGREALRMVEVERPTLTVLDAMMPYVDGFEVLRRIRQNSDFKAMPILMLTFRKQENDIVGALRSGANDYLVKPFMPEELLARIARLLEMANSE